MPSVWINPAATHTARIPYLDHSSAIPAANVSSAARAVDEWIIIGIPRRGLNPRNATNPRRVRDHPALRHALRHVPRGVDVQPMDGPHPLERDRLERRRELPAGVVHQDVDPRRTVRPPRRGTPSTCSASRTSRGHRQALRPGGLELAADGLERLGPATADRDRARRSWRAPTRSPLRCPVPPPVTIATAPAFASDASGERKPRRSSSTSMSNGRTRPHRGTVVPRPTGVALEPWDGSCWSSS